MAKRVAVVAVALSDEYFFPIWKSYYGTMFGFENLFAVTFAGGKRFDDPSLGAVIRLPVKWDDTTGADVISECVAMLLTTYDAVIRVDVDEILAVDPRVAPSLKAFIEADNRPYHTARGFDVVQTIGEEPLRDGPLLAQRNFAYPASALNKTCIVRTPVRWTPGFHWCSVHPDCGPLFMLHLKRIDIAWQMRWFAHISTEIADNPKVWDITKEYYTPDQEKILRYHHAVSARTRLTGIDSWYRAEHQANFMKSIVYHPQNDVYAGAYGQDMVLCELPEEWKSLL